jgi:hypothetical protein
MFGLAAELEQQARDKVQDRSSLRFNGHAYWTANCQEFRELRNIAHTSPRGHATLSPTLMSGCHLLAKPRLLDRRTIKRLEQPRALTKTSNA